MKRSVRVTILGQDYTVRSETEPEEVLQVAELANRRIAAAQQGAASSFTAVVLALLNVAGELHQLRKLQNDDVECETRIESLLNRLEEAGRGGGKQE